MKVTLLTALVGLVLVVTLTVGFHGLLVELTR